MLWRRNWKGGKREEGREGGGQDERKRHRQREADKGFISSKLINK